MSNDTTADMAVYKRESIDELFRKTNGIKLSSMDRVPVEMVFGFVAEAMKQKSTEFFKWYGVKMMEYFEYFKRKRKNPVPYSIPDAYDKAIEEFEGQTLDELYEKFIFYQSKFKP